MQDEIIICGKRGLGDLISGISYALLKINEQCNLRFCYPPGFNYGITISTLMDEYDVDFNTFYRVDTSWFSVSSKVVKKKYGERFNKTVFFTSCYPHKHVPFKTQWKRNSKGPIGLCLNNENTNDGYPYKGKWFDKEDNDKLLSLVDDKNYILLGRPKSVKENIQIMSECRYVLGVDGAWAHASNSMNVPYYLCINNYEKSFYDFHRFNTNLYLVPKEQIFKYV